MVSERKFWRTQIVVEILSEDEPYLYQSPPILAEDIRTGDISGIVKVLPSVEIDGKAYAQALFDQGSDPEFFMLNDDGSELDDEWKYGI